MLALVPDTVDKREGSIIYNTLSPCAFLMAQQSYMIAYLMALMFADTAEEEWLDRVVTDFGVTREAATYAVRQINLFDSSGAAMDAAIGNRFQINDVSFALTEKITTGQYKATCEQAGSSGNLYSGAILNADNINNFGSATLIATPLISARDDETDDDLRTRFYEKVRQSAFGGNIADYEEKVLAIDGVGAVEVFPAHIMGTAGAVGLVIGDEDGKTASSTLVNTVQTEMGTDGDGIAPIGHTVTVETSTDLTIDVSAEIQIKTGSSFATIQPVVVQAITDYINAVGFKDPTIFYAKLQAAILDSHSDIVDIGAVTINGAAQNLALSKTFASYQVPVVGTITVTEVSG
ncbi:baseplate J/gp47 family protein [Caproiciproducens sp. NJN-50]|uniref:baseplate J/gp47 family protein n=1 Tax=Caproiciproducens sp. NJN-50 TaxID=2507162 RepID=UPI001FA9A1E3|nr:baseplate J/gp47 family protein [Caproiciproducens sp. NJN-50]